MFKRSLLSALCFGVALAIPAGPAAAAGLSDVIRTLETPFQARTAAKDRINDYTADFFQESKIASLDRLQRASGEVAVAFDYRSERTVPTVRFHWRYEQPTTQEIVSNGETMWVYLPENNQVIQSDIAMINQANQNDPMTFLTGLGNLSRDFTIRWAAPNQDVDGNYVLELTPRRVSSLISKMIIVVDRYAVDGFEGRGQDSATPQPQPEPPGTRPTLTPPPGFPNGMTPGGSWPSGFAGDPGGLDVPWFPILSTAVYDPNGNSTLIEFSNLRVNTGHTGMTFEFIMPAGVQVVRPTGKEMGY